MINLNTYLIEKLHLNKDIDNNITMSFSEWCNYINKETDGCIFRNTRHFWIITLEKNKDDINSPELCIEIPPDKQNYWQAHNLSSNKSYSNKDINIFTVDKHGDEKEYNIKLEDLDRDNIKRFTFTKNNADQIIKALNELEIDI